MIQKTIALGRQLSKKEMRNVTGGVAAGTCCSHNSDWSYSNCGISQASAQSQADYYASSTGNSGYWCCASCPQVPN